MRTTVSIGVILVVAVASGCTAPAPAESPIPAAALPSLVLQPEDLDESLIPFDEGRIPLAETPTGPRSDVARFGRQDGWKARYRVPGDTAAGGVLVVESTVDLFESADGAAQDLAAHRTDLEAAASAGRGNIIESPPIGEETIATTSVQAALAGDVRFYTIVWRYRNVTASVSLQGFEGEVTIEDAADLARKQQARLKNPSLPSPSPP